MSDWIERHSVDCFCCGQLVDERDCRPGLDGEGDLCPACLGSATKIRTEDGYVLSRQADGTWSDGDLTFDGLGELDVSFTILEKG